MNWRVVLLLSATVCSADTLAVTFTNLPWTQGGSPNEYVGWSIAAVGGTDEAVRQLLMCDDFYDDQPMPAGPFQARFSVLGNELTASSQNGTVAWSFTSDNSLYFSHGNWTFGGSANAALDYAAAGYLAYQYARDANGYANAGGNPGPTPQQTSTAADYNFAIWNLFDSSASLAGMPAAMQLERGALSFVLDPANTTFLERSVLPTINVYSPTGGAASLGQEFLQETPEAGTLWLGAVGVVLIVLTKKIRGKR